MSRKEPLIVAIINNKGGVGKTTCTTNLSHALALKGKKTLVVDLDSQANMSSIFCRNIGQGGTLYDVLKGDQPPDRCIYPTGYENLFCLPNHAKTATLEVDLYGKVPDSYFALRHALRENMEQEFDLCMIDCPPNLGIFVMMALICCDCVIVPVTCGSRFSTEGLGAALGHIEKLQNKVNNDLYFLRLLVNQVEMRSKDQKAAVAGLRNQFGKDMVFDTVIPRNPVFLDAERSHKTVIREAPNSTGAKNFRAMADEFIKILKLREQEFGQLSLLDEEATAS